MNEKEVEWAEGLYELEERFTKIAEEIFEENKGKIYAALTSLWSYLDEGGVTNEALRHAVRSDALRNLGAVLEYESSLYADRLRDSRGLESKAKKEVS